MDNPKVVYLHFNDPSPKPQDYFFGSILAMYDMFTEEELGIKYNSLLVALKPNNTYMNPRIKIIIGDIIRRKNKITKAKENAPE